MSSLRPIPKALAIVAILFLLEGVGSIAKILVKLYSGSVFIDFGVLGIPIFFGLRRFSAGWRTCALLFLWMGLLIAPIMFISGFVVAHSVDSDLCGIPLGKVAPIWGTIISVPLFFLTLWQYRVLTCPDLRARFYPAVRNES